MRIEQPWSETGVARPEPGKTRAAVFAAFWFGVVPALLGALAVWLSHLGPAPNGPETLDRVEAWLRDQPMLVFAGVFVTVSVIVREFADHLPPRGWSAPVRATQAERKRLSGALSAVALVLGAVALAVALRAWVFEIAKVRSGSMMPTLYPGDVLLVSKLGARRTLPQRGEPLLFDAPDPRIREQEPHLFKRVIGLPGDTLMVEGGQPIINGWRVPRCQLGVAPLLPHSADVSWQPLVFVEWLGEETYLVQLEGVSGRSGPYTVKPGEVWVLGDNRNNSADSRAWFEGKGGGVPLGNIHGKPVFDLFNTLGIAERDGRRIELPRLPVAAGELSTALTRCLALKPSATLPPARGLADAGTRP